MKKALLTAGIIASTLSLSNAQTFVSTDPANRNAVLEEYTGWQCQYCPDGHRRANDFQTANPGRVVLINLHEGGYASPGAQGFDIRTQFGAALAGQTNLAGYPAATVNRHEFAGRQQNGSGTAMSRGEWAAAGAEILAESSPVNVAAQASLDIATRVLTVDVEAYYTGNSTASSNFLNVVLLEDGIIGPQIEAGMGTHTDYEHNHVLRHMLTGQWGEEITTTTQGTFVSKQYTYTLPATIGSETVNISNLEVGVFLTETTQEVITGSLADVELGNFPFQNDAGLFDVNVPELVCGTSVDGSVNLINNGEQVITNATFSYSVNGGTPATFTWNGTISSFEIAEIQLPEVTFSPQSVNNFEVSIVTVNGNDDENAANNSSSSEFQPANYAGTLDVTVTITTDQYGDESSWEILDDNEIVIASGDGYGNSQTYTTSVSLTEGVCYTFVMKDAYGDGMCCSFGNGSYSVKDMSGRTVLTGGTFANEETTPFKSENNVGISESGELTVKVYPNPSNGMIFVDLNQLAGAETQIRVINTIGEVVYLETISAEGVKAIDMNNFANGVYTVQVNSGNITSVEKISVLK